MSSSKKKREDFQRQRERFRQRRLGLTRSTTKFTPARFDYPDVLREIGYITQRAQEEEVRVVVFGKLVFFSTATRDAWMLDPEDDFAMCLSRNGEPQPYEIGDTPTQFAIQWTAKFAIEGDAFVVEDQSGRVVAIRGYPTAEIAAACGR